MLYGSETWWLRKNETAILNRTEKAMIRAMCRAELIEKRSNPELMDLLVLEGTLHRLAKSNTMQWYGHVLRRDTDG